MKLNHRKKNRRRIPIPPNKPLPADLESDVRSRIKFLDNKNIIRQIVEIIRHYWQFGNLSWGQFTKADLNSLKKILKRAKTELNSFADRLRLGTAVLVYTGGVAPQLYAEDASALSSSIGDYLRKIENGENFFSRLSKGEPHAWFTQLGPKRNENLSVTIYKLAATLKLATGKYHFRTIAELIYTITPSHNLNEDSMKKSFQRFESNNRVVARIIHNEVSQLVLTNRNRDK